MKRVGVDVGGTFTDLILVDESSGQISVDKLPSTQDDPARAVIAGVRRRPVAPAAQRGRRGKLGTRSKYAWVRKKLPHLQSPPRLSTVSKLSVLARSNRTTARQHESSLLPHLLHQLRDRAHQVVLGEDFEPPVAHHAQTRPALRGSADG